MPWTVSDVDSHKKGLTPAQKKKWVSIANSVLADCEAKGGSGCEGKAIRIANSKFSVEEVMERVTEKITKGALCFMDHNAMPEGIGVTLSDDGSEVKSVDIIGYSGGIIKNHWRWDDLLLDLSGVEFPEKKYPILEEHFTDKIIGHTGKPKVNGNLSVDPSTTVFADTEEAKKFIRVSKGGFPYQASVYALPSVVERVEEGAVAEANGIKLKGPGTIFRKWKFMEVSICVFGWDSKTKAAVLSQEFELSFDKVGLSVREEDVNISTEKGEGVSKSMTIDLTKLKQENPEDYDKLLKEIRLTLEPEIRSELQAKFDQQKSDIVQGFTTQLAERDDKILNLQKSDAIRTENELKAKAKDIWLSKLAESNVSDHLYDKVRAMVPHTKFVKDGIFDEEAFSQAVDAEIEDWEKRGATSQVIGTGFASKGEDTELSKKQKQNEDDQKTADTLLSFAGQKQDQKAA